MRNKYSFSEFFSTSWALIQTRLFYQNARLIRRPVYIRGKKSLIGACGLTTGHACRFDLHGDKPTLFIGNNCEMGDYVHIVAQKHVEIGNNVLMASKIFISDTNHGTFKGVDQSSPHTKPNDRPLVSASVSIDDNVWIGENAVILAGVKIGKGCIIGANSVVNRDIDDFCMVAGSPAMIIKKWDNDKKGWIKYETKTGNIRC